MSTSWVEMENNDCWTQLPHLTSAAAAACQILDWRVWRTRSTSGRSVLCGRSDCRWRKHLCDARVGSAHPWTSGDRRTEPSEACLWIREETFTSNLSVFPTVVDSVLCKWTALESPSSSSSSPESAGAAAAGAGALALGPPVVMVLGLDISASRLKKQKKYIQLD